ncbi:MAG: ATP-binding protein [Armatimonadota bacterium]
MVRKIVHIDEELCDGCGLCVPACAEGAIRIVDGKARLTADQLCDGLGACLGECPRGAITIIEREAEPFDEAAVGHTSRLHAHSAVQAHRVPAACPGSRVMQFGGPPQHILAKAVADTPGRTSQLRQWPVQLALVPPTAPYLEGADILLAADCVPFAYADFHNSLLSGRALLVGCPKLDNAQWYVEKLAQIISAARPASLTVAHMEVPCCSGLLRIAELACQRAGVEVPINSVMIGVRGEVIDA